MQMDQVKTYVTVSLSLNCQSNKSKSFLMNKIFSLRMKAKTKLTE